MVSASRLPRRLASALLTATLAMTALGAVPAAAVVGPTPIPDGCATVSLTSPSPLVVHVAVADCGDPSDTEFAVVAELVQDSTKETIKSWGSPATLPVGPWIDEPVSVPAQGGYTLRITAFPGYGGAWPTEYPVKVLGGVAVTVSHPELRFGGLHDRVVMAGGRTLDEHQWQHRHRLPGPCRQGRNVGPVDDHHRAVPPSQRQPGPHLPVPGPWS